MPRIAVDNVEPDSQASQPLEVPPEKPVAPPGHSHAGETATDKELEQKSGTSAFLSAFSAFPAGVSFAGEHTDEEIILLMRAHIVTNVPWILAVFGLALVPLLLLPILGTASLLPGVGAGTGLVVLLLWYFGLFTYAFLNFLYWYFNVYIVTNERIVDIDWYSLTHREMNVSQISRIQDITSSQIGVLAGIFDYGHIFIQTAGTEPNFDFHNVPHPQLVVKKIQELMQAEEKEWETR